MFRRPCGVFNALVSWDGVFIPPTLKYQSPRQARGDYDPDGEGAEGPGSDGGGLGEAQRDGQGSDFPREVLLATCIEADGRPAEGDSPGERRTAVQKKVYRFTQGTSST